MWSDAHRTPRYVWAASAIAATTLHVGGVWWATTYWPSDPKTLSPPIEVIAVPGPNLESIRPSTSTSPTEAAPQTAVLESSPSPSQVAAAPDETISQEPAPEESPRPQVPPTPPTSTPPSPTTPSETRPQLPQNTEEPTQPADTLDEGEISANPQRSLQTALAVRVVPQGRDLPDELPKLPPNWRSVIFSSETSACFSGMASLSAAQVTLRLTVEADGSISESRIWESSGNSAYDNLVGCLVETQMPRFTPALTGGEPIPTDMVLLTVEGRFTE